MTAAASYLMELHWAKGGMSLSGEGTIPDSVEALRSHLAAIVESSDDAIISKNLSGIVLSWNRGAERLFGYTAEEIIGQPISVLAPPERKPEMATILERIKRGERIQHHETERRRKDGSLVQVSVSISPVLNGGGQVVGAAKIARDIAERKAYERSLLDTNTALQRANADLQQFAYAASHDLQEPLRAVSLYSQLLTRKFAGSSDAQAHEYSRRIVDNVQRMTDLIAGLLQYTRLELESAAEPSVVAASVALEIAEKNVAVAVEESAARVEHGELPTVRVHTADLVHVFQNLIANAIKFRATDAPHIRITGERTGEQVTLSVADNGVGIDPQYSRQIFDVLKRLHGPSIAGAGIGLAICKRIVERYGGRIWVEANPGGGAVFRFTLPAG